jgi:phosphohistidine phosphatase
MQVHLLRHGTAEDISGEGSDAKRKLTGGGRDEVRRAAECARRAKIAPTLILSSPFVRAIETAEIAAEVLAYRAGIVRTEALIPSASPQRVWNEIRNRHDAMQVLLAGHEPLLSHLAAYLLNSPALRIDMRKASFVRIDLDLLAPNPSGILKWMATPDICPG